MNAHHAKEQRRMDTLHDQNRQDHRKAREDAVHRCPLRIVRTASDKPMKRYNASCRIDVKHFNEWGPTPEWLELLALQRGLT